MSEGWPLRAKVGFEHDLPSTSTCAFAYNSKAATFRRSMEPSNDLLCSDCPYMGTYLAGAKQAYTIPRVPDPYLSRVPRIV